MSKIDSLINYSKEYVITTDLNLVGKEEWGGLKVVWLRYIGKNDLDIEKTAQNIQALLNSQIKDLNEDQLLQIQKNLGELQSKFKKKSDSALKALEDSINSVTNRLQEQAASAAKSQQKNVPKSVTSNQKRTSPARVPSKPKSVSSSTVSSPVSTSPKPATTNTPPITTNTSPMTTEVTKTEIPKQELSKDLAEKLSNVQKKINQLNPNQPYQLKKIAEEIQNDLTEIIKKYPSYRVNLQPLWGRMNILKKKGHKAFKHDFIQQYICEKYQAKGEVKYTKPLEAWIKSIQTNPSDDRTMAENLLNNLPKMTIKWFELKERYLKFQLKNIPEQLQNKADKDIYVMHQVQKQLSDEFDYLLEEYLTPFNSPKFRELLNHYPILDMEKTKEEILEQTMQKLIDRLDDESEYETLVKQGAKKIIRFFELRISQYKWLQRNLIHIKTAYDQSLDHSRNVGEGICLQACLQRHKILTKNKNILTKELEMGGDETVRKRQAQININLSIGKGNSKYLAERFGFHISEPSPDPVSLEEDPTSESYRKLVNSLFSVTKKGRKILKQGEPLQAILILSDSSGSGHAINVQVDEKLNKYRIFDDNLGAVTFSSYEEFKEQLASYFETFYSQYDQFKIIRPK